MVTVVQAYNFHKSDLKRAFLRALLILNGSLRCEIWMG
jgi:hypothetical protein